MERREITTIHSPDRLRRVTVFQCDDGTYGFHEEYFPEEPLELCRVATGRSGNPFCATLEIVLREVAGRVDWLAEMITRGRAIAGWPRGGAAPRPPERIGGTGTAAVPDGTAAKVRVLVWLQERSGWPDAVPQILDERTVEDEQGWTFFFPPPDRPQPRRFEDVRGNEPRPVSIGRYDGAIRFRNRDGDTADGARGRQDQDEIGGGPQMSGASGTQGTAPVRQVAGGRIAGLVIAAAAIGVSVWCAVEAERIGSIVHGFETARPMDAVVDLSQPGEFTAPFRQTCSYSHGQGLELLVDPDDPSTEAIRALFQPLAASLVIQDADSRDVDTVVIHGGNVSVWNGRISFGGVRTIPNGDYLATLRVTSGVPALAGKPQRVVSAYQLCGQEMTGAYLIAAFSLGALLVGVTAAICVLPGLLSQGFRCEVRSDGDAAGIERDTVVRETGRSD